MYTIKEAAERTGLTAHTIRYYDREGLLPFVGRTTAGNRAFSDNDLAWMELITCLKNTGMPIRGIRDFVQWYQKGDDTLQDRLDMFVAHRENIREQLAQLERYLDKIDKKVAIYEAAVELGSLSAVRQSETA